MYEVRARRKIQQSPLDDAPDVPRGTPGTIEDEIDLDDLYAVDFGDPWGVVLASPNEIEPLPSGG